MTRMVHVTCNWSSITIGTFASQAVRPKSVAEEGMGVDGMALSPLEVHKL